MAASPFALVLEEYKGAVEKCAGVVISDDLPPDARDRWAWVLWEHARNLHEVLLKLTPPPPSEF